MYLALTSGPNLRPYEQAPAHYPSGREGASDELETKRAKQQIANQTHVNMDNILNRTRRENQDLAKKV